jgi:hypothetical protein
VHNQRKTLLTISFAYAGFKQKRFPNMEAQDYLGMDYSSEMAFAEEDNGLQQTQLSETTSNTNWTQVWC